MRNYLPTNFQRAFLENVKLQKGSITSLSFLTLIRNGLKIENQICFFRKLTRTTKCPLFHRNIPVFFFVCVWGLMEALLLSYFYKRVEPYGQNLSVWDDCGQKKNYQTNFFNVSYYFNRIRLGEYGQVLECGFGIVWTKRNLSMRSVHMLPHCYTSTLTLPVQFCFATVHSYYVIIKTIMFIISLLQIILDFYLKNIWKQIDFCG